MNNEGTIRFSIAINTDDVTASTARCLVNIGSADRVLKGIAVSILVIVWLTRLPARGRSWLAASLALVVGGAVGNIIDRVRFGHGVDFISVHYERWYYPAFNVADSAITVGAILLLIESLLTRDAPTPSQEGDKAES